jgi:tetratricopeptide (TPR) repeat protein
MSRFPSRKFAKVRVMDALREGHLQRGIEHCRLEQWETGLRYLAQEFEQGLPRGSRVGLACSYLGYARARVQGRLREGLKLCRWAVRMEAYQPEIYLNLARVLRLVGDRRQAIEALDRGLQIDPGNPSLVRQRFELGWRQAPTFSFLPRRHVANRLLGRLRFRFKGIWAPF